MMYTPFTNYRSITVPSITSNNAPTFTIPNKSYISFQLSASVTNNNSGSAYLAYNTGVGVSFYRIRPIFSFINGSFPETFQFHSQVVEAGTVLRYYTEGGNTGPTFSGIIHIFEIDEI